MSRATLTVLCLGAAAALAVFGPRALGLVEHTLLDRASVARPPVPRPPVEQAPLEGQAGPTRVVTPAADAVVGARPRGAADEREI